MPKSNLSNEIFMTIAEVVRLTCLGRSSVYLQIQKGTFPGPYKLGERMARWKTIEVMDWIDNLQKCPINQQMETEIEHE